MTMIFQSSSTSRSSRLKPTGHGFWRILRLLINVIPITIASSMVSQKVNAQIIPDSTLPVNSSVPNGCSICAITGGTLSNNQQTLFHSFQQFSVPTGGAALFQNNSSLVNIVTRVTGTLPSDIDGAIAAQGNANLFLLNPNGIIFGPNAVLQVPGSFIASSADSLIFTNGTTFGSNPSDTAPLLTVSTPMGLQFGTSLGNGPVGNGPENRPGSIRVEGPGHFPPTLPGLFVTPGNTLALVGGQVEVEGGTVSAPSGRLEVGGVTQGTVKFTQSDRPGSNGLDLNFDQVQDFGSVHLSQGALLNASGLGVSGGGSGDIDLQGNTILMEDGSQVLSITTGALAGGQLTINATDSVTVQGASENGQVISRLSTDTGGAGTGGNLVVNTPQLRIRDRALLSASTGGSGKGGNLILTATDFIEIQGTGYEALQALFLNAIQGTLDISAAESGLLAGSGSAGDAGQLFIDTGRLHLQEGAIISTTTSGGGAGGNAEITATESVDIIGSVILTGALQGTTQKAGNLTLETERLGLHDGGLLQTFTLGTGDGGDLIVNATESVEVLDTPVGAIIPTGIFANSIFGTGTGGDIEVKTQQLTMTGGGQIGNQTGAFLGTGLIPVGGPAGDITLNVNGTTTITGLSADGQFGSGPGTSSFSGAAAGNVMLTTGNLFIQEGANISTTTFSDGDGGTLSVTVDDVLELSGTGLSTTSGTPVRLPSSLVSSSGRADFPGLVGNGAAGTLQVSAGELIIREGAAIAIDSLGSGDAGTLTATAGLIHLDNGGNITAKTAAGTGGNVVLRTPVLLLRNGSSLNTDAGNADGGNITLDTGLLIALENSDITANALHGRGGQVNVTAQSIFGIAFREQLTLESDITATSALGPEFNGEVALNTPDLDPDSGLVRLPVPIGDSNDQIIAGCTGDHGNRFAMVDQGGVPTAPNQRLEPSGSWQDLRFLNGILPASGLLDSENHPVEKQSPIADQSASQPETIETSPEETSPIREASLVQTNEQGEIMLTAQPSTRLALRDQAAHASGDCAANHNSSSH